VVTAAPCSTKPLLMALVLDGKNRWIHFSAFAFPVSLVSINA
jgi:hypothetical protein